MFRLKKKPSTESFERGRCAASRCDARSCCTDASGAVWAEPVPLCEWHWDERCDELEASQGQPLCEAEGCNQPVDVRGLCIDHYEDSITQATYDRIDAERARA